MYVFNRPKLSSPKRFRSARHCLPCWTNQRAAAGPACCGILLCQQGYNPNVWFDNVEIIAAQEIGRETVQYVANIYKYYLAYSLSFKTQAERNVARSKAGIE